MGSNAIHLVPLSFSEAQGEYLCRQKPLLMVAGGSEAAMGNQQSFFTSPQMGPFFATATRTGVIPMEFIVALFAVEFPRGYPLSFRGWIRNLPGV